MGGGNPVKQVTDAVTDTFVAPTRELARAAGLDGVVDLAENIKREAAAGTQLVSDLATGEGKRKAEEAAKKANAAAAAENTRIEGENKQKEAAANAAVEDARMSAGSKSRTLLTGPKGLEDETDASGQPITMSRKTLRAR